MRYNALQVRFSPARWCCVAGCLLLVGGCMQEPATVTGRVLLDGRPLTLNDGARGTVVFQPAGGEGAVLTGTIDSQGRYKLSMGSSFDVMPGPYNAAVSAVQILPATADKPEPSGRRITPAHYARATESGLRVRVEPGPNEIPLELTSAGDAAAETDQPATKPADDHAQLQDARDDEVIDAAQPETELQPEPSAPAVQIDNPGV